MDHKNQKNNGTLSKLIRFCRNLLGFFAGIFRKIGQGIGPIFSKNEEHRKAFGRIHPGAGILFGVLFSLLALRLIYLMTYAAPAIGEKAKSQLQHEQILTARRGDIQDRHGNLLAASAKAFQVDVDLKVMRQNALGEKPSEPITPEEVAKIEAFVNEAAPRIASTLGIGEDQVRRVLLSKDEKGAYLPVAKLATKVDIERLPALEALTTKPNKDKPSKDGLLQAGYHWLIWADSMKRYYPNKTMLAQTIGIINDENKGQFGLEARYDDVLAGTNGLKISEVDKLNRDLPLSAPLITQPVDGHHLVLTIDEKIQAIAEKVALEEMTRDHPKSVQILVGDPNTGEILAMVNSPSFDLNDPYFTKDSDLLMDRWKNKILTDSFEPGSTFKIVPMVAALSEGVLSETDDFFCPGFIKVNGIRINCSNKEGHGHQNYKQVLANSCNPGIIQIGLKLGKDKLQEYASAFGLSNPTGIDLAGEADGLVDLAGAKNDYDLANKIIGQATMMTDLQLFSDINVIASGGYKTTPHLMRQIKQRDESGKETIVSTYQDKNKKRILSEKVAQEMVEILTLGVEEGTSKRAAIKGIPVLGKTGTAQKIDPKTGKYDKTIASFAGAAPANAPKISVFIAVDEPVERYSGGSIAAPMARKIMEESLQYLQSNN